MPEGTGSLHDIINPLLRLAYKDANRKCHAALAGGSEGCAGHCIDDRRAGGIGEDDAVVLGSHVALHAFASGAGAAINVLALRRGRRLGVEKIRGGGGGWAK